LDFRDDTHPNVQVEVRDRVVTVQVAGYRPLERSAEDIAAGGHLLETVLRRPLLVRGMRVASR